MISSLGKENGLSSVLRKERDLIHKGTRKNCHDLALALPCPHEAVIIKYEEGKERKVTISYNAIPVKLPGRDNPLFLVILIRVRERTDDATCDLSCKCKAQRNNMAYCRNLSYPLEM